MADHRKRAKSLVNRITHQTELSDEDRATFYSGWHYSAVRLLTSIQGANTADAIRKALNLPLPLVQETLQFLVQKGLCRFDGKNYSLGPAVTHLEASSKFISRHHTNWRLRAIENHPVLSDDDLVFIGPLTISRKDGALVREKLIKIIKELGRTVESSEPEDLRVFNLDWVRIAKPQK